MNAMKSVSTKRFLLTVTVIAVVYRLEAQNPEVSFEQLWNSLQLHAVPAFPVVVCWMPCGSFGIP